MTPCAPIHDPTSQAALNLKDMSDKALDRIHILRVLATFFVVGIHTNSSLHSTSRPIAAFSIMLDVLYRVSVPTFFLITGALLVSRANYSVAFYRRRFARILPAWIAWAAIYILYRNIFLGQSISLLSSVRCFITGDTYYHLWFMAKLFGVYLALPVLRVVVSVGNHTLCSLLVMHYVLNIFLVDAGTVMTRLTNFSFAPALRFDCFSDFCILGIAGFALTRSEDYSAPRHRIAWFVFIACYVTLTSVTVCEWMISEEITGRNYFNTFIFPMACSLFYVVIHAPLSVRPGEIIRQLSELSFGIYLCHPLVYETMIPQSIKMALSEVPLLGTIFVFSVSAALIKCLQSIPGIRQFV